MPQVLPVVRPSLHATCGKAAGAPMLVMVTPPTLLTGTTFAGSNWITA